MLDQLKTFNKRSTFSVILFLYRECKEYFNSSLKKYDYFTSKDLNVMSKQILIFMHSEKLIEGDLLSYLLKENLIDFDDNSKKEATKEFAKNIKKHIDDISSKYIISNETADQAVLFLPAEAIFSEVHAYHPELVHYAAKKRVWIASPTTLLAMLSTVQSVLITIERNKHMDEIHQEINKLGDDFTRYEERWDDLSRHLSTVQKDVDKLHISSQKLSERFKKIVRL